MHSVSSRVKRGLATEHNTGLSMSAGVWRGARPDRLCKVCRTEIALSNQRAWREKRGKGGARLWSMPFTRRLEPQQGAVLLVCQQVHEAIRPLVHLVNALPE